MEGGAKRETGQLVSSIVLVHTVRLAMMTVVKMPENTEK